MRLILWQGRPIPDAPLDKQEQCQDGLSQDGYDGDHDIPGLVHTPIIPRRWRVTLNPLADWPVRQEA
jgi:hypothetical protein